MVLKQTLIPIALVGLLMQAGTEAWAQESPAQPRQQQLDYLLKHDCGSCHGMTLQGGLGPSLLPNLLQQKGHTVDSLSLIISKGVPGTAMPPWGPILADDDIRWIANQLLQSK
ncbi:MAG: cytochrome c [Motiliproteus sp.]|nr:cytochrome c [Motiliproteus sp.]MCW9052227.1 cytochrome c [Motiliproteus sp.]